MSPFWVRLKTVAVLILVIIQSVPLLVMWVCKQLPVFVISVQALILDQNYVISCLCSAANLPKGKILKNGCAYADLTSVDIDQQNEQFQSLQR